MDEQVVKKSVSLRADISGYPHTQSERLHGGNFSAYLTYLISKEKKRNFFR
ncbi:hypothetical protein [Thalassobacillus devorans]|uniref:hypothetical protein n=1 Tax=Thalassobacillus devorans TaxID=279813 RepID=UPI0015947913|nr:hypothetical protein [Thalassobacillus devorans]